MHETSSRRSHSGELGRELVSRSEASEASCFLCWLAGASCVECNYWAAQLTRPREEENTSRFDFSSSRRCRQPTSTGGPRAAPSQFVASRRCEKSARQHIARVSRLNHAAAHLPAGAGLCLSGDRRELAAHTHELSGTRVSSWGSKSAASIGEIVIGARRQTLCAGRPSDNSFLAPFIRRPAWPS